MSAQIHRLEAPMLRATIADVLERLVVETEYRSVRGAPHGHVVYVASIAVGPLRWQGRATTTLGTAIASLIDSLRELGADEADL